MSLSDKRRRPNDAEAVFADAEAPHGYANRQLIRFQILVDITT
jgi:hypothetical protein